MSASAVRRVLHLYPGEVRARAELLARQRDRLAASGVALVLGDDWIADSDRALYADTVLLPPAEEVGAAARALVDAARRLRLDGILVQTEAALPAGALALHALGLPGPSPAAAFACIAKHRTRELLAAAGVDQPAFALAQDGDDVRRFAATHGFPIVLKGVASTMARLIEVVADATAIEAAVARLRAGLPRSRDIARFAAFSRAAALDPGLDPTTTFLVESFAAGAPVETDGFVVAGRATCFGALEQVPTATPRFYLEGYLLPADRAAADAARLRATGERAALACGLDQAGFSVELRDDGTRTRVIEVNGRLGEDAGLHRLFDHALDGDTFALSLEIALGGQPRFAPRDRPRAAVAYQCAFTEATVAAVPTAAELAVLGLEGGNCVRPGDALHAPPHPETFPHLAWALASDPDSSRAAFARARAQVGRLRFTLAPTAAAETARG